MNIYLKKYSYYFMSSLVSNGNTNLQTLKYLDEIL